MLKYTHVKGQLHGDAAWAADVLHYDLSGEKKKEAVAADYTGWRLSQHYFAYNNSVSRVKCEVLEDL